MSNNVGPHPWFHRAAAGAAALPAAGCSGDYSTLAPAGPAAEAIALIWWIMLAGATIIFLATLVALAGAFIPSIRPLLTPKRLILWGGLVVPSLGLTALVAGAFTLGERLLPRQGAETLRIEVVARQFAWEFRYPGTPVATRDVLHIPVGRDIDFAVTSEDVIHSFWIPRLGGKIDAIPGHKNIVRLRADAPGNYGGICAEYCGKGHAPMRFTVIAHAPEDYEAALTSEAAR
ncbi:cytochrome c oxidase subunit II [Chelatococcus sp. XZ-Ab1]|uniref:cytochrome c oxidase subunit II n=1 Tax=Chelatococcus sp. XZ-Ab1 TaxID=3034027 RepID=UPI0023E3FE99|nr:cytochrome c oxidase subunit II [Chelatococcus sp. XZ-Ab1]